MNPQYTSALALSLRQALESGDLSLAIQIQRSAFPAEPAPFMHETDENDLREYLETPLPMFSFCSKEELREMRIRMTLAVCLRVRIDRALEPDDLFRWEHPMAPKAAAQNFIKYAAIHRNVNGWIKSGVVQAVKILNSNDGPCSACKAAAEREYALSDLPEIPLHNCENMNTVGCRCSVVASQIKGLSQNW